MEYTQWKNKSKFFYLYEFFGTAILSSSINLSKSASALPYLLVGLTFMS